MLIPPGNRIRDFAQILLSSLNEANQSISYDVPIYRSLESQLLNNVDFTEDNLVVIGTWLLNVVDHNIQIGGRRSAVHTFWQKLFDKLQLRCPRANSAKEWLELRDIENHPQFVLKMWDLFLERWIRPPIPPDLGPVENTALIKYRESIENQFNSINLSGFGGPGAQTELEGKADLSSVYIDLDARARYVTEIDSDTSVDRVTSNNMEIKTIPALRHFALNTRFVLVGLPGSGKSTLLKYFSLCLAQSGLREQHSSLQRLNHWPIEEIDLVPVFIELRTFAAGLTMATFPTADGHYLYDYIISQLKFTPLETSLNALKVALNLGRAIILLDGLDEIPNKDEVRRFVLETIENFAGNYCSKCRVIVTCRPRSYDEPEWQLKDFSVADLAPLSSDKVARFIDLFYAEVARRDMQVGAVQNERKGKLVAALARKELQALAANPFMLTVMAWLHRFDELPRKRALILNKIVEQLLYKWEERRIRDDKNPSAFLTITQLLDEYQLDVSSIRRVLCRLAFRAMHREAPILINQNSKFSFSITKADLLHGIASVLPKHKVTRQHRNTWANKVVDLMELRTGLLVPEGTDSFTMAYKLQEYLAGEHFTDSDELRLAAKTLSLDIVEPDFGFIVARLIGKNTYWEEVVKWAAAIQSNLKNKGEVRDLVFQLCKPRGTFPQDSKEADLRRAIVAQEILWEVGLNEVSTKPNGLACINLVRQKLEQLSTFGNLSPVERASAGAARANLEELPRGTGVFRKNVPDIAWVKIQAGNFIIGDKLIWEDGKKPKTSIIDAPYRISRYLVTVAQFQEFVNEGGYEDESYWRWSNEAIGFLKGIQSKARGENIQAGPANFQAVFQTLNHPQVGVSWFEALAFCQWLNQKPEYRRYIVRLPGEMEWERAARGTEGRPWPWGDDAPNPMLYGNYFESGIGHTSTVGIFPFGDTPPEEGNKSGIADLFGNVWEWCLTEWKASQPIHYDGSIQIKLSGANPRAARGGSFEFGTPGYFSPIRRGFKPADRTNGIGFRLACSDK